VTVVRIELVVLAPILKLVLGVLLLLLLVYSHTVLRLQQQVLFLVKPVVLLLVVGVGVVLEHLIEMYLVQNATLE